MSNSGLNIIAAAGEICSLLAKSLIVFFPFFFQPHLFQHQFHLSSLPLLSSFSPHDLFSPPYFLCWEPSKRQ